MMTMLKMHELRNPTSCLNKARPDEPIFVLRAKDPLAAQTIRLWAEMAGTTHEDDKVTEAYQVAQAFDDWRCKNVPQPAVSGSGPETLREVSRRY
jgi:hypothetical protein